MQKKLLTTAILATFTAISAQAAEVFNKDDTKVDAYGRIQLQLVANDAANSIEQEGSRFGFKVSHKITDDVSAYGNLEFRYKADEVNSDPFTTRNTFFGAKGSFGDVTVGNFDSIYYQTLVKGFDILEYKKSTSNGSLQGMINNVSLDGGSKQSRGDSIAYQTPSIGGFKAGVQVKHQSETQDKTETVITGNPTTGAVTASSKKTAGKKDANNLQGYVSYTFNDKITAALGANQDNDDMGGSGETILGASVTAAITQQVSVLALYETQGANDTLKKDGRDSMTLGALFNYGKGDVYGFVARNSFDTATGNKDKDNVVAYTLGTNYRLTKPFYVFAEVYNNNDDSVIDPKDAAKTKTLDHLTTTVGARFSF